MHLGCSQRRICFAAFRTGFTGKHNQKCRFMELCHTTNKQINQCNKHCKKKKSKAMACKLSDCLLLVIHLTLSPRNSHWRPSVPFGQEQTHGEASSSCTNQMLLLIYLGTSGWKKLQKNKGGQHWPARRLLCQVVPGLRPTHSQWHLATFNSFADMFYGFLAVFNICLSALLMKRIVSLCFFPTLNPLII